MDPIICITGPTASGKTELSLRLAEALGGEIVSCDSMQVYKRMDIGTAKPTRQEQSRAVHHMIDVAQPEEDYSVGKYVAAADLCVQEILSRNKPVIIVGGTGLYCDSLLSGRSFAPIPSTGKREALAQRAEEVGMERMLAQLHEIDPQTAERLHPADRKRILRALEVFYETGMTITQHNLQTQQLPPRYTPVYFTLNYVDRAALYRRIDRRVEQMRVQGLEQEVRELLSSGVPGSATAMQAIGYKELAAAFDGAYSIQEAYSLIAQRSRNYAKRQLTWFRRNANAITLVRSENQSDDALFSLARQNIPFFTEQKW